MRFSEQFNVTGSDQSEWFDPILSISPLFIDPFLVYAAERGHFGGSHDEVIAFFNVAFRLIAQSGGDRHSISWRRAASLLVFPEVAEICLGYTGHGTRGSGSGRRLGQMMALALWEAIQAGVTEITHFEEVEIIREGIGADRISDITANLIRGRLAHFTEAVCREHGVPTRTTRYRNGVFDLANESWSPAEFQLPYNPHNERPILLVPKRYLSDLPRIDAYDFWQYCYLNENETLRDEFGADISRRVDKRTIVAFARRHQRIRAAYIRAVEQSRPRPYDFERDPQGVYRWYEATLAYCQGHPQALFADADPDFEATIRRLCEEYRQFIENNQGWQLLWNDNGEPRTERAAQTLFLGIVKHYCRANNIEVSREPNIGRGPVDFKFSRGYEKRALLEVKKADNTRFWNGLLRQLPTYMEAEEVNLGFFLIIVYSDADAARLGRIQEEVAEARETSGRRLWPVIVEARQPPSASRL